MNIKDLTTMIADPAGTAEQNFNLAMEKWKDVFHFNFYMNVKGFVPNLRALTVDKGLGKILLIIKDHPGIKKYDFYYYLGHHPVHEAELLDLGCVAKLIKCEQNIDHQHWDRYSDNPPPKFYITDLGLELLKQNGLL